ncbi:MAG: tRNA (adenosine(37)-N6)-dimethylallyltransferase MiaA [Bacteroidia bacterium]|jgi:tRNA dimethylallyltransferase|nr:tRNA (adenosine(37)-N6)-dimethylallyltransferase MiaA [Bacteroidia bacterium]|tara:strand:+ start:407 stop:1297 length:891 start_codon:yes stop_codon:yes gene_type:complete
MTASQQNKKLIVIAGPTAVGKTELTIRLAQYFETEIISCDSRQLYTELKIGVARPSDKELKAAKHHFIASHSIHDEYNAGKYAREVNELLKKLFTQHDVVIMTGGTGLYIKAATEGLDLLPTKNEKLREQLNYILETEGLAALKSVAKSMDLVDTELDFDNPVRLMRAIEIKEGESNPTEAVQVPKYETTYLYLDRDRDELYSRINKRVDTMLAMGLEDEARTVHDYKDLNALHTVGYKEMFSYFDGEWTYEHTVEKIKQHTRNYAKRQLTWFRNQGNYTMVKASFADVLAKIQED